MHLINSGIFTQMTTGLLIIPLYDDITLYLPDRQLKKKRQTSRCSIQLAAKSLSLILKFSHSKLFNLLDYVLTKSEIEITQTNLEFWFVYVCVEVMTPESSLYPQYDITAGTDLLPDI